MTFGPIMLDIRSTQLEADEFDIINHPFVGGVILFSRNFESTEQIQNLCDTIRNAKKKGTLLIAVDQEGGRVQRFRKGFTSLPACCQFGNIFNSDDETALRLAKSAGWLMASELLAVGVDFSFAPVLDLNKNISQVIGDRAFHADPQITSRLAKSFMTGMNSAGMAAVGKHFPGHGSIGEDSHTSIPVDDRRYEDLQMEDLIPFESMINSNISAIMPAHVIYPKVDSLPAGFSKRWLGEILRKRLNFTGAIFSDDLSMTGAEVVGGYIDRCYAALDAGCDMLLICNEQEQAVKVLDQIEYNFNPTSNARLMRMQGKFTKNFSELCCTDKWLNANKLISDLIINPELDLGDDPDI